MSWIGLGLSQMVRVLWVGSFQPSDAHLHAFAAFIDGRFGDAAEPLGRPLICRVEGPLWTASNRSISRVGHWLSHPWVRSPLIW